MLDPLFFPYFGGTEKVVYEVGKRLVKRGHQISVLTSMIPQANGVGHEEIEGMEIHRTASIYFDRLPLSFLPPPFTISPLFLPDLFAHAEADIFHAHNRFWYYPPTLAAIKLVMRKKLMLTIHNSRPSGISPSTDLFGGLYDDTLGRLFFSACDHINCVSRSAMETTIPKGMHGKCSVVYNGVDTKAFAPGKGEGDVRKKFGIPESAPLILSNGRFVTQKGFSYLLDAFAKLRQEIPDARLLIIGKGPLKEQLLAHAKSLGIAGSFSITTGIPEAELPYYYNSADIFALPSLYEPSAVVLSEALACGKPIVATSAGGIPEVVAEGCGLIVPPRDSDALCNNIFALLKDDGLRKKMEAASRKRALKNFDWDIIAANWDSVYREVCGGCD